MAIFENGVAASIANTGSTLSATLSTNGPGRLILLAISHQGASYLTTPPTIGGNAMTRVSTGVNTNRGEIWSYLATTQLASAAVSVPLVASSSSAFFASMKVDAYYGVSGVDASTATNQAPTGAPGSYTQSVTTTEAYDYVVAYATTPANLTLTAGTGYTILSAAGGANSNVIGEYANAATATPGTANAPFNYNPGNGASTIFVLGLRSGPVMASVSFSGTTGTLTWASLPGGVLQASGFGTTQGLTGTATGGAFTINAVTTSGLTTTFTTSLALGAGETGTLSAAAGAFTDNSSTSNPCPGGTVAFTIAGASTAPRNLTVTLFY